MTKVFIDAPHCLKPVDLVGQTAINGLESLGAAEAANADTDASLMSRGWWKVDPERKKAQGLAESLESVKQVLMGRRFDVSKSCVGWEYC
jgi:Serine hydrolase (FSH1)